MTADSVLRPLSMDVRRPGFRVSCRARWLCVLAIHLVATLYVLGQTSLPEIWSSKTSKGTYRLTSKGKSLRAEKIFPAEFAAQVADGAFTRCDYTQQGAAWLGKCESHLPLQTAKGHLKWCKFKFASRITSLTSERIEGESDVWENEDVDAEKCEVRKSHPQHFVWVPRS
jgi:hypothetical protein